MNKTVLSTLFFIFVNQVIGDFYGDRKPSLDIHQYTTSSDQAYLNVSIVRITDKNVIDKYIFQ